MLTLIHDKVSHFHHHYLSFIHVFLQREYLSRIESTLGRYKAMVKGYDFAGVTDLYHENQRINEQNKVSALVTIEIIVYCNVLVLI